MSRRSRQPSRPKTGTVSKGALKLALAWVSRPLRDIHDRWGVGGFVFGLLVLGCALAWWNWAHIRDLPGVRPVLDWLTPTQLPAASPDRFSIAVAHLEDDVHQKNERLILEALEEYGAVQVLRLDRTIDLNGADVQQAVAAGHDQARELLERSRADVLIWGKVLQNAEHTRLKLRMTPNRAERFRMGGRRYAWNTDLNLPELFWADLNNVLGMVVSARLDAFMLRQGELSSTDIHPYITQVQRILHASPSQEKWSADDRAALQYSLAIGLSIYGKQTSSADALKEAINLYRSVLKACTNEARSTTLAEVKYNLGFTLVRLGAIDLDNSHIEEAITHLREVLAQRPRSLDPLDWAHTNSALASAEYALGWRFQETQRLEAVLAMYRESLKEFTLELVPLDWAYAKYNIGLTLKEIGKRTRNIRTFDASVQAFRDALQVFDRERSPRDWADTKQSLGSALDAMSALESGTERVLEAIEHLRDALHEQARERVPQDWGGTQLSLADALLTLGLRSPGTGTLTDSVSHFLAAQEELTRRRDPINWASAESGMGLAQWAIGLRTKDAESVCNGLAHCISAWSTLSDANHWAARRIERNVQDIVLTLSDQLPGEISETCLDHHAEALDLVLARRWPGWRNK